ncbi:MAG: tRNA dihydrouridine synthase DusB [Kiritimatiellia bacterium]
MIDSGRSALLAIAMNEIRPLKIGNLVIDPPALLAPMAGYTNAPFRLLCRELGCGLAYTEMIIADGIARRIRQAQFFMETLPGERPLAAHLYGTDPGVMAEAARIVEETGRFDLIDLNCGCPVRKIARRGAGVSLMKDPENLFKMVSGMVQAVSLPVTVKTRIGISKDRANIAEVAQAVEEAGASALSIHARFASDRHSGEADWNALREIKAARKIPVIGNGGIKTAGDATRMMRETGVDAVMIGRRAVGNPWIFREIKSLWREGRQCPPADLQERRELIRRHLLMTVAHAQIENQYRKRRRNTAEQAGCCYFRAQLVRYLAGLNGYHHILLRMECMNSVEEIMKEVDLLIERNINLEKEHERNEEL